MSDKAKELAEQLLEVVVEIEALEDSPLLDGVDMTLRAAAAELTRLAEENARLDNLINNPHTNNFLEDVRLEAAHQRERWAAEHDAGKTSADWFWLVGYLAGKALTASSAVDESGLSMHSARWLKTQTDKALHHIITTAAVLLNWHAARTGADTRMRPGISDEAARAALGAKDKGE